MKSIMFKTKIFHEGKMYLLVSDVTKLMEISEKAFCKKYSDKIVEIPGCRKCIAETDFNLLISYFSTYCCSDLHPVFIFIIFKYSFAIMNLSG
jgi:hypothetical protein